MASSYALAVFSSPKPWIKVEVSRKSAQEGYPDLLAAALAISIPNKSALPIRRENEDSKAYLCRGTQCYRPVGTPRELLDLLQRLALEN